MQLPETMVRLFDYPVADILAHLPPASSPLWDLAQFRQHRYQRHGATRSIVFLWLENTWQPGEAPIVMRGHYASPELTAAVTACAARLSEALGGQPVKLLLAELAPGGSIAEHTDQPPALTCVHRCHVPIETNDEVIFAVDGHPYRLEAGVAYEFDNTRKHSVENRGATRRVHLLCDVMPASPAQT